MSQTLHQLYAFSSPLLYFYLRSVGDLLLKLYIFNDTVNVFEYVLYILLLPSILVCML